MVDILYIFVHTKCMQNTPKETQVRLLHEIASTFTSSLDLQEILDSVLKLLDKHLNLNRGTITLLDPITETLKISFAHGLSEQAIQRGFYQIGEGITGKVVKTGNPEIVPDIKNDPRFLDKTGSRSKLKNKKVAFICVPIKDKNQTIGALSVDTEVKNPQFLQESVRLLDIITPFIAQAYKVNKSLEENKKTIREENLRLRQDLKEKFKIDNMVGNSNAMQEVYRQIEQVTDSKTTVLIRGESGTGKELVAHALHYNSIRANKPFIKVNCTALPETLLESELFGHEKGAFTGAVERKKGRFELANGGTIFLDEIGDFSQNLQVKLLRVLQTKEFERVGGNETIQSNVRIICATNSDLENAISKRVFREDLYYRINVFPIFLPPLRERKNDIMSLANYFIEKYNRENMKNITRISTPAINMLTSYHWPGNVRELENCIERAILVCNTDVIRSQDLPPSLQLSGSEKDINKFLTLDEAVQNLEKEMIIEALKRNHGHQGKTAEQLGTTRRILGYKIQKHNIVPRMLTNRQSG
ncbi:MAG: sigma 54-interacting transcriptional regulator [Candidatus Margulisiibacteriota bacterium]